MSGTDFHGARTYRLPDEKGCDFAATQRRRQHLRIEVLHGHRFRIDVVLGQIFGNKPGTGRADAGGDGLADEVLRRLDVVAGDRDIAFGVTLDHCDGAVIAVGTEEILHARQVAGHDDIALAGLESRERRGARGKQPVRDV